MTRIHEILAAVGKAGLADWDELHAIIAAVETAHNITFHNAEEAAKFRVKYGSIAADMLFKLNGEAN